MKEVPTDEQEENIQLAKEFFLEQNKIMADMRKQQEALLHKLGLTKKDVDGGQPDLGESPEDGGPPFSKKRKRDDTSAAAGFSGHKSTVEQS